MAGETVFSLISEESV